jgi:uncharacterized DUF497 family protein
MEEYDEKRQRVAQWSQSKQKRLQQNARKRSGMCNNRHVVVCPVTSLREQNVRIISIRTGARDSHSSVPL